MTCQEVSMQEIKNWIGHSWNDKTIFRDIKLLKSVGIPIHYSGRRKAFVLVDGNGDENRWASKREPTYPESKKRDSSLSSFGSFSGIVG